jgi:hypothetical protein
MRVLSPSYPDVLALSQGRADLFALRRQGPARRHPHRQYSCRLLLPHFCDRA